MRDEPSRPLTVIYQSLREQIERGLLARGSKLPSERQLSELFSTTRITLREALGQLEDQGLIYREERRGWFVSPQRLLYNPLVRSHFHAMVADQGRVPETEVLGAVGAGLSNAQIGMRLFMSEATVKAHVSKIFAKLDCSNRVQIAIIAHEAGLTDLDADQV